MAEKKKRIVDANPETPVLVEPEIVEPVEELDGIVLECQYIADRVLLHIAINPTTFTIATLNAEEFMVLFQGSIFDGEKLLLDSIVGHWVKFNKTESTLVLVSVYQKPPSALRLLTEARKAPTSA